MITRRQGGCDGSVLDNTLKETTTKPTLVMFEGDLVEEASRKIADGSVRSILIHEDSLFYGGEHGLFESKDRGKSWNRLYREEVLDIAFSDKLIIATKSGCWMRDGEWKRIFFISYNDDEKEELCLNVACDKERIFFAKGDRLFVTEDEGRSWERVRLALSPIKQLILSEGCLYIAQEGGVYRLTKEGLSRLPNLTYKVTDFSLHCSSLLVATEGGIFEFQAESNEKGVSKPDEPDIFSVQQMAIRYAEVSPEKIAKWRRQAKYKALLPDLSISYYNTINYNTTAKDYAIGPKDWSVSFGWNLGDLIYSSDQTTIDSRSKLMVDLRGDILDEVNQIYFARKRLIAELYLEKDDSKRLTKELLVEELSARLDGFTGGGFSRKR
ncbi:hypothetical protein KKG61_03745 [bacterium]|nr:hypothetical protein [bacterium]